MDEILFVLWSAISHLFPANSIALPTRPGCLGISWPTLGDPHAAFSHSTPILIRVEEDLLETMRAARIDQQRQMARRQEPVVRAGMTGYNPYAVLPQARVIVLG